MKTSQSLFLLHLVVSMEGRSCVTQKCKSGKLAKLVLSFYHRSSGDWIQVARLGSKCSYSLSTSVVTNPVIPDCLDGAADYAK